MSVLGCVRKGMAVMGSCVKLRSVLIRTGDSGKGSIGAECSG